MPAPYVSIQALGWLLAAQLLILLPLAVELPLWLTGLALLVMAWRLQLGRGRGSYPSPWLKVLLAFTVMGALALTFRSFAMNAMVSLLVAGFVLKLLELKTRTDVSLLCYLSYFVIGTQLLYTSGFFGSVYALLCVLAVTLTLMINHMASGPGRTAPAAQNRVGHVPAGHPLNADSVFYRPPGRLFVDGSAELGYG